MINEFNLGKFLKTINFFSHRNTLFHKQQLIYNSKFGFLLSLTVTLAFLFIIIIYFSNETYDILINDTYEPNQYIDLSYIPFLVKIVTKDGVEYEQGEDTYKISSKLIWFNFQGSKKNVIVSDLKMQRCSELKEFSLLFEYYYDKVNLSSVDCIVPGQNTIIRGIYMDASNDFSYIQVNVQKCEPDKCIEGFNEIFDGARLYIFYLTNQIEHDAVDGKNVVYRQRTLISTASSRYPKKYSILLSKGSYKTQKHTYQKAKEEYFFQYHSQLMNIERNGVFEEIDNTNEYVSTDFAYSGDYTHYLKYHTNCLVLMAYFGGWLELVMSIGKIINFFVVNKIYKFDLFHNVIDTDSYIYKDTKEKLIVIDKRYYEYSLKEKIKPKEKKKSNKEQRKVGSHSILRLNESPISLFKQNSSKINDIMKPKNVNDNKRIIHSEVNGTNQKLTLRLICTPFFWIDSRHKNFKIIVLDSILSEYLSLDSLYHLNKHFKHQFLIDKNYNTPFAIFSVYHDITSMKLNTERQCNSISIY